MAPASASAPASALCTPGTFIAPAANAPGTADIVFALGTSVTATFVGNVTSDPVPANALYSMSLFCGWPITTATLVEPTPFTPSATLSFASKASTVAACTYTPASWTWTIPADLNITGTGCFLTLALTRSTATTAGSRSGASLDNAPPTPSTIGTAYSGSFDLSNTTTVSSDPNADGSATSAAPRARRRALSKGAWVVVGLGVLGGVVGAV